MAKNQTAAENQSQSDKFVETAHEHEADEDEARWNERLRKIAKAKQDGDKRGD